MRHPFRAGIAPACAALVALAGGCAPDGTETSPDAVFAEAENIGIGIGSEFMAQEAPPAVGRPVTGVDRGPRLANPAETAGRFPFYWTRGVYSGFSRGWWGGSSSWATDFPKGDRQFLVVLKRLVNLNAYDWENAVRLDDPDLRKFPLVYMVEVGRMQMTQAEIEGLRGYLDAGGFVIFDDFWGPREWAQFQANMYAVYPDRQIVDIGLDHPIYSAYYDIEEVLQVPAIGRAYSPAECYGCNPIVRGIYDDEGRLSVIINFNTDLGDAWEWAEDPRYPLDKSTYAYQMGANMIVYAMSH